MRHLYKAILMVSFTFLINLCPLVSQAASGEVSAYTTQVPVAGYAQSDWQKAVGPALKQLLIQLSKDPNITQNTTVRKALVNPDRFVQSYHYSEESTHHALMLEVHFVPEAIDTLIQSASVPVSNTASDTTTEGSEESTTLNSDAPGAQAQGDREPLSSANMVVSNIKGLSDYTNLMNYLKQMPEISDVSSQQTKGDRVLLKLTLRGSQDHLKQTLSNSTQLTYVPIPNAQANTALSALLSYRWMDDRLNESSVSSHLEPSTVAPTSTSAPASALTSASLDTTVSNKSTAPASGRAPIVEGVPTKPGASKTSAENVTNTTTTVQTFGAGDSPGF